MSETSDVYTRLAAPFTLDQHSKVRKGGTEQTYVPWTDYVERLNQVLGPDQWSFRILREGFTETECWVLAELTATVNGQKVVRQQYGCEPITKGRDAKPTTDLLKSTASDALKKAVSLLGPGLYLSIQEERAEVEAAMQEAIRAAAEERRNPTPRSGTANTGAAAPGTPANRSASTPTASSAKPTSSSTPTTPVEATGERWARLVAEAARVKLPTLGAVKAIDPQACGEAQLAHHCNRLEARLAEVQKGAA